MYVLSKIEHLFIISQTTKLSCHDKKDVFLSLTSSERFSKNRVIKNLEIRIRRYFYIRHWLL